VTPKILICDDEPLLRELIRAALGGEYAFEEAGTVADALEAADRFLPDLAVVDVMMPGGSGLDVVRHLRRERADRARSVVVSAFSADAEQQAAVDAGADAFVAKPFDPDELAAIVDRLLASVDRE
jgi:DNA-binding response OmpR family regulator